VVRRLPIAVALGAVLAAIPATTLGHPGHGPIEVQVGDDFLRPAQTRVAVGDTVVWKWLGPDGNHSVTADPGQAESFDSDPGKATSEIAHPAGFAFTHQFTKRGSFTYRCRVHASMAGQVTVIALPPRDVTRPSLSKLSVRPGRVCPRSTARCRATRAYVHLSLSEPATVVARMDRAASGRWHLVRTFDFDALRGRVRHRLHVRGFEPGPYRLRLVAYDYANNRSRSKRARFRVGRP
jgi:plastocyanin